MISGHLQVKSGRYYMVIKFKDDTGNWKAKWKATKLLVNGNKKRAEEMLRLIMEEYEGIAASQSGEASKILFADYVMNWLDSIKNSIEETTYGGYYTIMKNVMYPYFKAKNVTLNDVEEKPVLIQEFYTFLLNERGVKAATVHRYHANIRKALQYAVKTDLILSNPADKVDKPKKQPFRSSYYTDDELNELLEKTKSTKWYLIVLIASFYGLRRGEVVGLKWSAIDFESKKISICHTVTNAYSKSGKQKMIRATDPYPCYLT